MPKSKVYHVGGASIISTAGVFYTEKNRINALLKNMSLKYLIKYNPLTFTFCSAISDVIFKRPLFLHVRIKGILWVLKDFKKTWCKRLLIQRCIKKIDYRIVNEYMLKTNLKLLFFYFLVRIRADRKQATEYYFRSCMSNI